jgi:hypothetical protein
MLLPSKFLGSQSKIGLVLAWGSWVSAVLAGLADYEEAHCHRTLVALGMNIITLSLLGLADRLAIAVSGHGGSALR